ncbi:hypothetical protein DFJ74DRAFT_682126 [Hyaloraphidium curvatum]|nr:hypothetical protein DFJ74DRAFT_682126 [Hyaloraphidium curvatum]
MTGHTGVAGTGTTSHQSTGISTGTTEEEIRTRVRAPVVHEEIRASEQVRVTPEVQREVVRPEIQQVVQPVTERVQAPTQVEIARAEGGVREVRAQGDVADERRYAQQAAAVRDETRHAGTERSRVEEQARVSETVRGERYQEIQPVIERVVEKPKVVEVQQHQKEIVHEAPKVHDLKVNAPIDISSAAPLLKGQGQAVGPGQYRDYENAPHAPGETKMHPSEKIPTREGHELKESTPRGA